MLMTRKFPVNIVPFPLDIVIASNIHLLHLLPPRPWSRPLPPRNPSPGRPYLPWPQRTLPLPYLLLHTSARRHAWHTSGRTCGPDVPMPLQLQLCCSTCTLHAGLSKISTWDDSGGLVVDANFKASWAPVNKLNGALGFDSGNSSIDIFGDDISTEEQAACHVFAMTRITFHHLVGWFKAGVGDLRDCQLLVVSFLSRDDRGVGGKREVDTRIGHEIGLELCQIDIESTIESKGRSD